MPVPSEPADKPPLKARLFITVVPLVGMVREAIRENFSNVMDDRLEILNDELVLPVSSRDFPEEVVVRLALTLTPIA